MASDSFSIEIEGTFTFDGNHINRVTAWFVRDRAVAGPNGAGEPRATQLSRSGSLVRRQSHKGGYGVSARTSPLFVAWRVSHTNRSSMHFVGRKK